MGISNKKVSAFTCKTHNLLTGKIHESGKFGYPLRIDRYQRPYVWDQRKIVQLLQDLKSHTKGAYYLGSILLHEHHEKEGLYIIDGQQRLTTLLLLYQILCDSQIDTERMQLSYYHQESYKNIKSAKEHIQDFISNRDGKQGVRSSLNELEITIIETDDIDLAFTFFDSQNSRGVRLRSTDLLKSFHLREINQLDSEDHQDRRYLEENSAKRWEHLQTFKGILSSEHDFAFELFHKLLWRARRWKGEDVEKENRDLVIEEFQDGAVRSQGREIPLYPNRQNMLSEKLVESREGGLQRAGSNIKVSEKSSLLPFTLRQPIHSGLHYFLFAEKYAELLYELFREDTEDQEIKNFRDYFDAIVEENSYYLKELFLVCSVTYYDKYGSDRLFEFAELLGLAHGIKRLEQYYIFRQSALKYIREYNLVDVITHSFRPVEVLESLKQHVLSDREQRLTRHVDLTDEDYDGVLDKSGVNERCFNGFHRYYDIWWDKMTGDDGDDLDLTKFAKKVIKRSKGNANE
ncbi:hypothetical protein CK503_04055 [Aliifodinibius salipaludis]|uniref:Uncharacterized protein n=1 Tax=Fodinibius salipaludis TaxID=2032627 RepID=A0A2A2GCI8_9BACT|nr:DUF262 domain-containing protein [Aliifodinibius salipaludis]PAU95376.1 hypothetical protein CK503_04055 [Aliifodinibius salipaludis]